MMNKVLPILILLVLMQTGHAQEAPVFENIEATLITGTGSPGFSRTEGLAGTLMDVRMKVNTPVAGTYVVYGITRKGKTFTKEVTLKEGKQWIVVVLNRKMFDSVVRIEKILLKKNSVVYGIISLSSTPADAEVYLDAVYKGRTPLSIKGVAAGAHAIKVIKSGYKEYSATVKVKAGLIAKLSPRLEVKSPPETSPPQGTQPPTRAPQTHYIQPGSSNTGIIVILVIVVLAGWLLLRGRKGTTKVEQPPPSVKPITKPEPKTEETPADVEKPTRQLIKEAVGEIGGVVSIDEVSKHISANYPKTSKDTISTEMSDLAVNGPPSSTYKDSDKFLFRVDRGKYRLYDPEKDGTWESGKKVSEPEPISPADFTPRPTTPSTFPPELLPRYFDVEFLGKGGFARVFKVKRKSDDKTVAVKIPISLDEATGKSFLKEIKAWEELKHENIVELYDMNIMPIPYFEMEYVENKSLEETKKPVEVEKAAKIVFDIAEGLKHAHGRGVIHRDLKPQNVLLTNTFTPKISDWGLSKVLAESKTSSIVSFSPLYAAPEQVSPKQFGRPDNRTDIYGLGVIFYELVTGKLPFTGESIVEISNAIISEEPEKPSKINPDARGVEPIITKCLAKKKGDRYQTAEELQKALAEYLKLECKKSLKDSSRKNDITKSRLFCGDLILLSAKLGDYTEVLKYLSILRGYAKADEKTEIESLAKEISYRIEEDIALSEELVNRLKILAYRVQVK